VFVLTELLLMTLRARLWPLEAVALTNDKPKESRTAKPGGLLDQYNLLGAIIDSPWATRLDHKVARHVIDRYYPKHGNGRASLRYLERATGSSRSNITTSLRRLAEHGAIIVTCPGLGTWPTEFALNFEFPASVPVDVTSSDGLPTVPVDVTSGGDVGVTSSASSVPVGVTESYLQYPAYKAEIQIDRNDTRPPTAPLLGDGLAATPARGSAVEELAGSQAEHVRNADKPTFELCYRTYACLKGKKEAKAAWDALPAEVDRAAVIEAAAAWLASWAAQGKPDAPRKHLATWLREERYDEDAPKGFTKVEKAKAKSKSASRGDFGIGTNIKHFTITAHETDGSPFADFWETFTFRADDGQEFSKRMHTVSATAEFAEGVDVEQKRGLCLAAFGKGNVAGDYVGRVVGANDDKGLAFFYVGQPVAEPEPWTGDVGQFSPFGTFITKIISSRAEHNEHGHFVTVTLDVDERDVEHTFDIETQKGMVFLANICKAAGLREIGDTDELHGLPMECTITERGAISYAALPAAIQDAGWPAGRGLLDIASLPRPAPAV
jgi:hypothetical protein